MNEAATGEIVVAAGLSGDTGGPYVHYDNRNLGGNWQLIDLGPIIRAHQDEWFVAVDRWHRAVSRRAARMTPAWWLFPDSRLMAWHPLDLHPLLFALGVMRWCEERQPARLHIVGAPAEAVTYLSEWKEVRAGRIRLRIDEAPPAKPRISRAARWKPTLRKSLSILRRPLVGGRSRPKLGEARLAVVSFALSVSAMPHVGDHFFGRVLDGPEMASRGGIRWLYLLSWFNEREAVRDACRDLGRVAAFDFELVRWFDLPGIVWEFVRARMRLRSLPRTAPPLEVESLVSRTFPENFFSETAALLQAPLPELLVHRAMRRFLREVRPSVVVYPYEEKGLERAILQACAEHGSAITTVGFAHAALNRGHICMWRQDELGRPSPSRIALTGPAVLEWALGRGELPKERLEVVGSPRAQLANYSAIERSGGDSLRVLFICGFGFEMTQLATFAEDVAGLFDGADLTIRRYPYGWFEEQDASIARLRALGIPFDVDDSPLADQIEQCDVVLFIATSAGIEAMLAGRVCIRMVGAIYDPDALEAKDPDGAVPQCATADELGTALRRIRGMDSRAYAQAAQRQREVAERIYSPWQNPAWL